MTRFEHEGCAKCSLFKHQCAQRMIPVNDNLIDTEMGAIKPRIKVVFVKGTPWLECPFLDASAEDSLLQAELELLGFNPRHCHFTSLLKCDVVDHTKRPTVKQIAQCKPVLDAELAELQPDVVVLFGNDALKYIGGNGISDYNGQVITHDGNTFVPLFAPGAIEQAGLNSQLFEEWDRGFEIVKKLYNGDLLDHSAHEGFKKHNPKRLKDLYEMRDKLLACTSHVSYDIETGYDAEGNPIIVTLVLTSKELHESWAFPVDHKDTYKYVNWTPSDRPKVLNIINTVLQKCAIITHTKYDVKLTRFIWGADFDFRQRGDTIILSRLLNSDHKEHGLKRLAGVFLTGMYDYDKELEDWKISHPECDPKQGGHYGNLPLSILIPYNHLDGIATELLHDLMYERLTDQQKILYDEYLVKADYVLGQMESTGFKMDRELAQRYLDIYRIVKQKYEDKLMSDEFVQYYLQDKQAELQAAFDKKYKNKKTRAKVQKAEFNPNSSQQLATVLYGEKYRNLPIPGYTAGNQPSCKNTLLEELLYDIKGLTESDGFFDSDIEFIQTYLEYKKISDAISKSLEPMNDPTSDWFRADGRVETNFILGGTKTGRLASRGPNLQNIADPFSAPNTLLFDMPIKNVFCNTWEGGTLLMADYAGMELRICASVANIIKMIEVFLTGGDLHTYVAAQIFKKPEDQISKDERKKAKWANFSLLYMGGWWTLLNKYRAYGLTKPDAIYIANQYYDTFPELIEYQEQVVKFAQANKFVVSPFGRTLALPAINHSNEALAKAAARTGVNMPIQGAASDILQMAIVIIYELMLDHNLKSKMVNTVHDSLVTDIYPGELDQVKAIQKDVMENLITYASDPYFGMPSIDFSWLKVPLAVDFDMGTNYGTYDKVADVACINCGNTMLDFNAYLVIGGELFAGLTCGKCGDRQNLQLPQVTDSLAEYAYVNSISKFPELARL